MSLQKFGPAKNRASHVLEQIVKAIRGGEYSVGEKLPPETELAEMLGVSRAPVREALAALRLSGIVKSKAGKGTFVNKQPPQSNRKKALSILEDEASPTEMFEARGAIEPGIAQLALAKASSSELNKCQKALEKMTEAVNSRNYKDWLITNREFHLAIAEATDNTALYQLLESALSYTDEDLWLEERRDYYQHNQALLDKSLQIHKEILSALQCGDKKALREKIHRHFEVEVLGEGFPE